MTFIRFAIMLHQHGILHDLDFLMDGSHCDIGDGINHCHTSLHQQHDIGQELEDQFSDPWSDEEHDGNAKSHDTNHSDHSHSPSDEDSKVELRMHSDTEATDEEDDHLNGYRYGDNALNTDLSNPSNHIPSGDSRWSNQSTQYIDVNTIGKGLSMVSLNSFQQLMKEHNTNHPP